MNIFRNLPFYAAADEGGGDQAKPDVGADAAAAAAAATAAAGDKGDDKGGDKGGSFLDGADDESGDAGKKVVAPADFPEDWRDKMAGEDKDLRKALDRYKSPADVAKANYNAQGKLRSGGKGDPMPDGEKEPEKLAEWRKSNGVPDDPTGYAIPDTIKNLVTDEDKPMLSNFTEFAHSRGVPAAAVAPVLEWYFQQQASIAEAELQADKEHRVEVEDTLRSEWGSEFRSNSQLAKRFADQLAPGVDMFEARMPDGRRLGSIPGVVKALADAGMREFGDVAFAGGDNSQKTLDRETELKTMMRDEPDKYFGNPAYSAELTKINEAKQRRSGARGSQNGDGAKPQ